MLRAFIRVIAALTAVTGLSANAQEASPACVSSSCGTHWVYFGTRGAATGVFAARFDAKSGRLWPIGSVANIARPTWLIAHPTLPVVYAVSEVNESSVFSLEADKATGTLRVLNSESAGGAGATHLAFDEQSKSVFVASYGSGQVSLLPTLENGRLANPVAVQSNYGTGPHRRQASPHAHGVVVDPSHRYVLAADLGADRVFVYRFDSKTSKLTPATTPFMPLTPGSGPRHLTFHPNGRYLFVVTELTAEVLSYRWDAEAGRLTHVQTLPLDEPSFSGPKSAAEILISPNGRYLYVSNRATDSIVVYGVNPTTGKMREVQRVSAQGKTPWSFALDPTGNWLLVANYGSNSIAVFAANPATGAITPTPESLSIPQPSNVTFLRGAD